MEWARTLRIDASPEEALLARLATALAHDGVRLCFGPPNALDRTYVVVEGPQGVDSAELEQRVPDGTWYSEAVIALAIEPAPPDALPWLQRALGGPGRPAGVVSCEISGSHAIVEFRPAVTQPAMLLRIVDVELQRAGGSRRISLLSPLTVPVAAAIAATGLQAPEIGTDRILESLLEAAHVE